MSIEAMKQALEALEYIDNQDHDRDFLDHEECDKLDDAITSLRQAIAEAEKQEPVAWMSAENECIFFDADKPDPMDYDFWTPLYTHPQPKAEQERKCENCGEFGSCCQTRVMQEGKDFTITHPQPKREPLTDAEFISMVDSNGIRIDPELAFEIKQLVEAAHGIKGEA